MVNSKPCQNSHDSFVTTPLVVQVFLPTTGETLQVCFDLDTHHEADVFKFIETCLEKAASFCNGKVADGNAATEALDRVRQCATEDLAFLRDQFKLVDEWKAKTHEAGVALAKLRSSYTMLRDQVCRKQNGKSDILDIMSFDVDDFLLANEVSKLIGDSQLHSCKEKMTSMEVEIAKSHDLIDCLAQRLGYENREDVCKNLDSYVLMPEDFQKAEQDIQTQLEQFKQQAERKFKLKRQQCRMAEEQVQSPKTPSLRELHLRQRRMSAPNAREMAHNQVQRMSNPEATTNKNSCKWSFDLDPESDDEIVSSDDEVILGLKARFEAKLRGREKFENSRILEKAKEKFLKCIGKASVLDKLKKHTTKQFCEREIQTDIDEELMYMFRHTEVTSQYDANRKSRTQDKGVGTEIVRKRDRGVNPIPLDVLLSNALLNNADMSADAVLEDTNVMSPRCLLKQKGANLPHCAGATQEKDSKTDCGMKLYDLLALKRPPSSAAPSSTLDKSSIPESRVHTLGDIVEGPYTSPFAGGVNSQQEAVPEVHAAGGLLSRRPGHLKPEFLDSVDQTISGFASAPLTPMTPTTPQTPSTPSKKNPRRTLASKAKFTSVPVA